MSTNFASLAGSGRATRGLLAALAHDLAARVRDQWRAYWDYQSRRTTALILEALDDRVLKDIGLSRSQILSAAFHQERPGTPTLAAGGSRQPSGGIARR
jgi:uncharacterized protein YjiS (DUF1127 family)